MLALFLLAAHIGCARTSARASEDLELGAPIPRLFAPRLSVATDYVPCAATADTSALVSRWTCVAPSGAPPAALLERARRASGQLAHGPNVAALRATALVDLEWSADSGIALNRSISYLRTASELSAVPTNTLADLSAAFLVRAERTQNVRDLLEAVDAASLALESDRSNQAARFNRALALEQLGLYTEAERAWSWYLSVDPASSWAREAQARRKRLMAMDASSAFRTTSADPIALTRTDPGRASTLAWNDLLGHWGTAELGHDTAAAARVLDTVARLGDALTTHGDDGSVAAAVRAIHSASGDTRRLADLARAYRDFSRAQELETQTDYSGALDWAASAVSNATTSPALLSRAEITLASALMYAGRIDSSERLVRRVREAVDTRHDPAGAARADWVLGTILLRTGRYEAALASYESAVPRLASVHDRENVGALQSLVAECAFWMGDYDQGYDYTRRAVSSLAGRRASLWRHNAFVVAAMAAAADGLPFAAAGLAEEGVHAADANGIASYRIESRVTAARFRAALGDSLGARTELAQARALMHALPSGAATHWMTADLQLASAQLEGASAARTSAVDSAVTAFASLHLRLELLPALMQRADLYFSRRDVVRGRRDLDSAIAILSAERGTITDLGLRASFLESARRVFDEETMLELARGDTLAALTTIERARASLSTAGAARPLKSRRGVRGRHLRNRVVLDLALVGDTLLIWTIDRNRARFMRTELPRRHVTSVVNRIRAELEAGGDTRDATSSLAELYDSLLRPVLGTIRGEAPMTIVADGELAAVPFAALYDRSRKEYLVEHHTIRYAPSIVEATSGTHDLPAGQRMALVSDPAFDKRRFPGLPMLPGADAEVRSVAKRYRDAMVLSGSSATVNATIAALRHSSTFHYAGHALFDDGHPENSVLVLAPDARAPTGALTAEAISRLRLRHHPLIVLSACETMRPGTGHSGDITGFGLAFMRAGAGGVLGSQWRASDSSTLELIRGFYAALDQGLDAAQALQAAQIALVHSQDPVLRSPSAWAAFRYTGQ